MRVCYVLPMACTKCVWGGDRRIDIFIVRGGGGPQENGEKRKGERFSIPPGSEEILRDTVGKQFVFFFFFLIGKKNNNCP